MVNHFILSKNSNYPKHLYYDNDVNYPFLRNYRLFKIKDIDKNL